MADPGWYPDPTEARSLRWFDGSVWTDHVAPDSAPPVALVAAQTAPAFIPAPPAMLGFGPAGGAQLAEFGTRLGAYLIDALIVVVPYYVVIMIAAQVLPAATYLLILFGGIGGIAWYFAHFEGGPTGQTIGKRQLGIAVVDAATMRPGIGAGRAVGRYFGRILSAMPCGLPLGYLWMLWDDDKQTWHDKLARTKVVKL